MDSIPAAMDSIPAAIITPKRSASVSMDMTNSSLADPDVLMQSVQSLSSSSPRSVQINNKIIENQRLGFHLADEIRNLREDLLVSKQDKRVMLVANQNLTEQLNKAEERARQLEITCAHHERSIDRLQKINSEEAQHYMVLQEKHSRLQADYEIKCQAAHTDNKQMSATAKSLRQMGSELKNLQDYANALELAVEELNKLNDQKQLEVTSLQAKLSLSEQTMTNKERREATLAADLIDMLDSLGTVNGHKQSSSPLHTQDSSTGCVAKLEHAVRETRSAVSSLKSELKKSKSHTLKLLKVAKYYEEMIPRTDDSMDSSLV